MTMYTVSVLPVQRDPVMTYLSSGSGTYTVPEGARYLRVTLKGPGCGGAGSGTTPGSVSAPATDTTFGVYTAAKGQAPSGSTGGAGGVASGGIINIDGQKGGNAANGYTFHPGGFGGGSGGGRSAASSNGDDAVPNSGGGGAGGGADSTGSPGAGGGEGAEIVVLITDPGQSYAYAVGTGSTGGTAGTSGRAGGAGALGFIRVEVYF